MTITLEAYADKLKEWEGTPYKDSSMKIQSGVDCVRFVVAVSDWLHGFRTEDMPPVPVRPPQTSLHNPEEAWAVVRWLLRRYPMHETIWSGEMEGDPSFEPGDILCVRTEENPGHAMIAGPESNVLWHANNSRRWKCVHPTAMSWCMMPGHKILRAWRPTNMRLLK